MKVVAVTNMLPSAANVRAGTFVEQQIRSLQALGVDVRTVFLNRSADGMAVYRNVSAEMREVIATSPPDVVHIMYGGMMAWLGSREAKSLPLVLSFCGSDLQGAEVGPPILRLRAWIGVALSKWSIPSADHIIVKSKALKERVPRSFPRSRISVIPNGVDFERFAPRDRHECRKRLGWEDGMFHVVIASPDETDANKRVWLARQAVKYAQCRGVTAQLHIMIDVPHDEVPIWLNAADALLMTSVMEGSPNIVKEALACNRPVVAVDVGDVNERLGAVAGCYVVGPAPEELGSALAAVFRGPGSVPGRKSISDLSLEKVGSRVMDSYSAAIDYRKSQEQLGR